MRTVGRFVYSLHRTVGVYNCRADHIFISHINLQTVKGKVHSLEVNPPKPLPERKPSAFTRIFSQLLRRGMYWSAVPQMPITSHSLSLHCTTVSKESCWGALLLKRHPLRQVKWDRRTEEKNMSLKFSDPRKQNEVVVLRMWPLVSCVIRSWFSAQHTPGFGLQNGHPHHQGKTENNPVPVWDTLLSGNLPGLFSINSSAQGGKCRPWSSKCSFKRLLRNLFSTFVCFHLPY